MKFRPLLLAAVCAATFSSLPVASAVATTPAPVVTTGTASAITNSAVTLTGVIAPEGYSVTYTFQFGPSASRLASTGVITLPASTFPEYLQVKLTGLKANTSYVYRLAAVAKAVSSSDTYYGLPIVGATASFKTKQTPTSTAALNTKTAKVSKSKAAIPFTCAGTITCTGRLTLDKTIRLGKQKRVETLGSTRYSLRAGKTGTIKLTLDKLALSLLRAVTQHRLPVTATAVAGKGQHGFKNKALTLVG